MAFIVMAFANIFLMGVNFDDIILQVSRGN